MRRTVRRIAAEPRTMAGIVRAVSTASPSDRIGARAARLRRESGNCLDIAVRERDAVHAAALIDEAARLARRAVELAES